MEANGLASEEPDVRFSRLSGRISGEKITKTDIQSDRICNIELSPDLELVRSEETVSFSLELDVTLTGGSLVSWLVAAVLVVVSFLSFMFDLGKLRYNFL